MNKPNWKDAPEWANYLAMDSNRIWCWFEKKPIDNNCCWMSDGKWSYADRGAIEWDETLEKRPGQNKTPLICETCKYKGNKYYMDPCDYCIRSMNAVDGWVPNKEDEDV